jgi:hypothetical chaperone protein
VESPSGAEDVLGIGLDFGTTNSALAAAPARGAARLATFASPEGETSAFRSVLYAGRAEPEAPLESSAGPRAIERYLASEGDRRLLQSLKSFLGSRLFTGTNLFGRRTSLEELIGRIVAALWSQARPRHPAGATALVVGRPVRFARARTPDDEAFALSRLAGALAQAGIERFELEYEPVAAAYHYEQGLERDELVLIADFGGGTSDFCLLRVGPGARADRRRELLGTEGVAVAGDAFDAQLVRHLVAPRLGRGSRYRPPLGKSVPVPNWIYTEVERWHHLSFLRSPRTLAFLHDVVKGAEEPDSIRALLHLVESDLGYHLYRSVERTKAELSRDSQSWLRFEDPPCSIEARVTREEFEAWIAGEVAEIAACVDRLLARAHVSPEQVDCVFLTGGSSFVPALRRVFETRFGAERLRSGGELTSVASGLALRARDLARA